MPRTKPRKKGIKKSLAISPQKQEDRRGKILANACWAACSMMVSNFYLDQGKKLQRKNMTKVQKSKVLADLAKQIRYNGSPATGLSLTRTANATLALEALGIEIAHDDREKLRTPKFIPTLREIEAEISASRPIVMAVHTDRNQARAQNVTDGHYVTISGVDSGNIKVIDPADGIEHTIPYNDTSLTLSGQTYYWAQTLYTDAK